MKKQFIQLFQHFFTKYINNLDYTPQDLMFIYMEMLFQAGLIVAPIMLIAVVAAFSGNLIQIGFLFTTHPLKFDLKKIDPISRMFFY